MRYRHIYVHSFIIIGERNHHRVSRMPVSCYPHLLVSQCDAKFSTNRRPLPPKHPMMPNQPTSDRKRFPSPFTPKRRRQLCCHFKRSSFTASSITSGSAVCWGGIPADCLGHTQPLTPIPHPPNLNRLPVVVVLEWMR